MEENSKNNYYLDIWYDVSNIDVDTKIEIMLDALNYTSVKKGTWHVDELSSDNDAFPARKKIDMSFDDIMDKFNDKCHFVIVHRRGYEDWKNGAYFQHTWKLEIGFSTWGNPEYFLWMYVDEDLIPYFEKKYKLTKNNY